MLMYPHIDPIALQLGPIAIHWYGLTYLVGFAFYYFLSPLRIRHEPFRSVTVPAPWTKAVLEDMMFYGVAGVILGGRIGYCLFYKPEYFLTHPIEILYAWQGGMSFHGGFLGVIIGLIWYSHKTKRPFWQIMDLVAPTIPLALASGRVGNFINGELWGRFSSPDLPWGMVFPQSGSMLPRHPSQIYQFFLEGVLLFIIVWLYARKPRLERRTSAVFCTGYGILRFVAEYFREPDAFLGLLALNMSMGQWLCVPMILFGIWLYWSAGRQSPAALATR